MDENDDMMVVSELWIDLSFVAVLVLQCTNVFSPSSSSSNVAESNSSDTTAASVLVSMVVAECNVVVSLAFDELVLKLLDDGLLDG